MASRKLTVEIIGDSSSLEKAFNRSAKSAKRFNVGIGTLVKSAVVFRVANEAMTGLSNVVKGSIAEFSAQQQVAAQTNAVIASTGGIANVTAKRVDRLADSLQSMSGVDDELIKNSENILLSFKNVRNEVGKGNKVFDLATKAALDLSKFAGGAFGSLDSVSKQLGKALNDPVRGMTALTRAGVTFTQGQKDTIKALVDSGKRLDAQKLILREVTSQVGGSAKAFGQTIPGALARTSEAFKNMGGALVGAVAPAFAKVANQVAAQLPKIQARVEAFVDAFKQAQTVTAKVEIVLETVGNLAAESAKIAGEVLGRVSEALGAIDWRVVGERISEGLARALTAIGDAVGKVDWGKVGQKIVEGIADFLKGVDWVGVFKAVVVLMVKAIIGLDRLLIGAGKEMARQLVQGIGDGIVALGEALKKKVVQLAIAILKPLDFSVFGHHLVPGLHSLIQRLEGELDDLATHAESTAVRINNAMASVQTGGPGGDARPPSATPAPKPRAGQTPAQAAAAATKRQEKETAAATAARKAAEAAATAAEKAATAARNAADRSRAAFTALIDSLNLRLERAEITRGLNDDLAALRAIEDAIRDRIKAEGRTTELARQLFENRQAQADTLRRQRQGLQFEKLGLTAEGEKKVPGVGALRKRLGNLRDQIKGTVLDTAKTRSQLDRIAKVLAGKFGQVGRDVRAAILQMFNDISSALGGGAGGGDSALTSAKKLNIKKILAGVGLSEDEVRELRSRLSQLSAVPRRAGGGARIAAPSFAGAGGFGGGLGGALIVNVFVDGEKVEAAVTKRQQKKKRIIGGSRAGTNPGGRR